MKYAFVFASILVIWVAVILMAISTRHTGITFLPYTALVLTVILFWIGFRSK